MPEHACVWAAALLGLCAWALAATGPWAEPLETEPFALRLSVEMAAHRRLVEIMDRAGRRPAPFVTDGCSGGLSPPGPPAAIAAGAGAKDRDGG